MREPPKGLHPMTRDLLARIQARKAHTPAPPPPPVYFPQENVAPPAPCVACGGTKKNSRGGPCDPCQVKEHGG